MTIVKKVAKGRTKGGAAVKKAPRASKKQKRILARAEGPQCFWVTDGTIIADLVELSAALKTMERDVFAHHVNAERNDFADWVEWVLGDSELAEMSRTLQTPKALHTAVIRRLKIYDLP
jgi:hypothetical protein